MDCQRCGVVIDPERVARSGRIKYCSDACNKRAYQERNGRKYFEPEWRSCKECGDQFWARSPFAECCSRKCSRKDHYRAYQRVAASIKATRLRPRPCEVCDAEFTPPRSDSRCCSPECYYRSQLMRSAEEARAIRMATLKSCPRCLQQFAPTDYLNQTYCSAECRESANTLRQSLRRYNISRERYGEIFAAQSGECAICRIPESEAGRRLAIDHDHDCCPGGRDDGCCGSCVRGLLCTVCNLCLGRYEATGYFPASFADYVDSYRNAQQRRTA